MKGILDLIETTKIDHIWSKLREQNTLQYLAIGEDATIFQFTQNQDQKPQLSVHM